MLIRLIAYPLVVYLGVIVLLMIFENYLLYHPIRASGDWWPPPLQLNAQDVEWTLADGTSIHGWWCPVRGSEGAVLFCHGNAGNLSHRGEAVASWQKGLGESVLIFDYPGYGKSAGKPSEAGCCAAAEAAVDWLLNERKVPPERIYLFGDSLGSGVVVELARRRPHGALILHNAFTSIGDMAQKLYPWLPARWLVRNRFDNLAKIDGCTKPLFVAHGDCDGLVPFSQGERLFAGGNEPKRFLRLQGCGHDENLPDVFFEQAQQFLVETGAKKPAQPTPVSK